MVNCKDEFGDMYKDIDVIKSIANSYNSDVYVFGSILKKPLEYCNDIDIFIALPNQRAIRIINDIKLNQQIGGVYFSSDDEKEIINPIIKYNTIGGDKSDFPSNLNIDLESITEKLNIINDKIKDEREKKSTSSVGCEKSKYIPIHITMGLNKHLYESEFYARNRSNMILLTDQTIREFLTVSH